MNWRLSRWWQLLGWLQVAAVWASSLAPDGPPAPHYISDKLGHAAAYFVLMLWFAQPGPRAAWPALAAMLFAMGGVLELLQGLLPRREASIADLAANSAGICVAWLAAALGAAPWLARAQAWLERR